MVPAQSRWPDSAIPTCYPGSARRSAAVTASGADSGKSLGQKNLGKSLVLSTRPIEVEASVARCLRTPPSGA